MTPLRAFILASCTSLPTLAVGGLLLPELDLKFRNEFQTAYVSTSSGSPGETRPLITQTFSGYYNPGEGGDPNAIEPVVRTIDRDGTQRVFDLSGRRIDGNVKKGIVIMNGRKVVVR